LEELEMERLESRLGDFTMVSMETQLWFFAMNSMVKCTKNYFKWEYILWTNSKKLFNPSKIILKRLSIVKQIINNLKTPQTFQMNFIIRIEQTSFTDPRKMSRLIWSSSDSL
jgi:hypothetical protein